KFSGTRGERRPYSAAVANHHETKRNMRRFKDPGFAERLGRAASARQSQLEKFKAQPRPDDPAEAERIAARQALVAAREARAAERAAARQAQLAAEAAAREAERIAREEAEARAAAGRQARQAQLEAGRKASRVARHHPP